MRDESSSLLHREKRNPFDDGSSTSSKETSNSSSTRDMFFASILFLIGSALFTACVFAELIVDLRSLPFWMLTLSGLLFCAGSIAFIRAFSGDREASHVLYGGEEEDALGDDEIETDACAVNQCLARHLATDLLVASWLFLAACVPVVIASACYVVHHDNRLYFWGVLAGSLAFTIASGFFVVASYPDRHSMALSNALAAVDKSTADKHCGSPCGSEWIVSNWLFLLLTAAWLLGSAYLLLTDPADIEYRFSFLEALIYFVASIYFVQGSYKAHAEAKAFHGRISRAVARRNDDDDSSLRFAYIDGPPSSC